MFVATGRRYILVLVSPRRTHFSLYIPSPPHWLAVTTILIALSVMMQKGLNSPLNFGDIRHSAPSFDEEEFDEVTTDFSEVFSNVSEPSPQFEAYSHGPNWPSGIVAGDLDLYLYDHPRPEDHMEWYSTPVLSDLPMPQVDTQLTALGPPPVSPPHAIGDMSIGELLDHWSFGFAENKDISADD
ncbi:hypothetical protein EV426DRAFT_197889 [Tirmania nivea]|nr:hypothetical protein EV426DRAFT_197889 [Tirmania nivea]